MADHECWDDTCCCKDQFDEEENPYEYGDNADDSRPCPCGRAAHDACGCCGQPLCGLCFETGAGFCTEFGTGITCGTPEMVADMDKV